MPVEKSASKQEFALALGLSFHEPRSQDLYSSMKDETIQVYNAQLKSNRAALLPQYANEREPFAYNQYTETALRTAVLTIRNNAAHGTRALYGRGQPNGENWVIRWMLYHVCRYRDVRNRKKAQSKNFHDDDDLGSRAPGGTGGSAGGHKTNTAFYDPARNGYRHN